MEVTVSIIMPKWDLSMRDGKITRWFKKEGDTVDKGDDLFEVETEKTTDKVKSPFDGKLSQIFIPAGKRVPVKVVVAILAKSEE